MKFHSKKFKKRVSQISRKRKIGGGRINVRYRRFRKVWEESTKYRGLGEAEVNPIPSVVDNSGVREQEGELCN